MGVKSLDISIGYWVLGIGYWVLGIGYWVLGIEYLVLRSFKEQFLSKLQPKTNNT
ncbi:MAG: hypothetical protein AAF611_06295 [Bacteroidota bacterium]